MQMTVTVGAGYCIEIGFDDDFFVIRAVKSGWPFIPSIKDHGCSCRRLLFSDNVKIKKAFA